MTADMRRRQIAEAVSFLGLLQFSGHIATPVILSSVPITLNIEEM